MRRINAEFTCRTNCSSARLFLDSFQTGGLDRPGFLGGRDLWEGWGSWYPEGYLKLNSKKYRLIPALNESEKVRSGRARIELTCACTRAPGYRVPGPPAASPAFRIFCRLYISVTMLASRSVRFFGRPVPLSQGSARMSSTRAWSSS